MPSQVIHIIIYDIMFKYYILCACICYKTSIIIYIAIYLIIIWRLIVCVNLTRPQSTQIFDQTLYWMFLWAEEQTKTLKGIQFTHKDICWIPVLSGSLVAGPNFLKRRMKTAVITWCFAVLKNSTGPSLKKFTIFESL